MTETTATEYLGTTQGLKNHDHDLIEDLNKRVDCIWRLDQYIANAQNDEDLKAFWENLKEAEMQNVNLLRGFIAKHVKAECF